MAEGGLAAHGGWSGVLRTLTSGTDLAAPTAEAAMAEILAGEATPAQIAAFAVALRMKGESVPELVGMVDAMLAASTRVELTTTDPVIDVVGTGGDQAHTINVSTISALVVAGAGVKVCKHGNRAASSACGAADLLEALGVAIELGPIGVSHCVEAAGIGFCFAPRYHPAMRHAGPPRRDLGIPTAFNILGPLCNPARVRRSLIGVADPAMVNRMAGVLEARGAERALLVHGGDGLDELTTTGPSSVVELRDGAVHRWEVDPEALGLPLAARADLVGGGAARNADLARHVLAGDPGAHRDIVVLNAGAGLLLAGVVDDLAAGIEAARAAIDSGAAAAALDALVAASTLARAAEQQEPGHVQ